MARLRFLQLDPGGVFDGPGRERLRVDLQTRNFTFASSTAYRFFRLEVDANAGASIVQLAEVDYPVTTP